MLLYLFLLNWFIFQTGGSLCLIGCPHARIGQSPGESVHELRQCHNEEESATENDMACGARVLVETLLQLAA